MTSAETGPEYIWGDIIKVPPKALCPDGIHPDYNPIYGVVVSSSRLWRNDIGLDILLRRRGKVRKSERVGQYLVALISDKDTYPALELKLQTRGPFKGWVIAAGLLVNVLESQIEEVPAPERYRGRLDKMDRLLLHRHLKKLIEYDPHKKDGDRDREKKKPGIWEKAGSILNPFRKSSPGASRNGSGKAGEGRTGPKE